MHTKNLRGLNTNISIFFINILMFNFRFTDKCMICCVAYKLVYIFITEFVYIFINTKFIGLFYKFMYFLSTIRQLVILLFFSQYRTFVWINVFYFSHWNQRMSMFWNNLGFLLQFESILECTNSVDCSSLLPS